MAEKDLTKSEAARQLGVSHASVIGWLKGKVPSPDLRNAIQVWSGGVVPKDGWGLTRPEKRAARRLEHIEPHELKTGTDA